VYTYILRVHIHIYIFIYIYIYYVYIYICVHDIHIIYILEGTFEGTYYMMYYMHNNLSIVFYDTKIVHVKEVKFKIPLITRSKCSTHVYNNILYTHTRVPYMSCMHMYFVHYFVHMHFKKIKVINYVLLNVLYYNLF